MLIDDAGGNYVSDKVYSDFNIHLLESLPRAQPHREVDVAIADASEEGMGQFLMLNPEIYKF